MDPEFDQVRTAAWQGDFDEFVSLLKATPELITATSSDPGDSPNLIQFIVVDGGLGNIEQPARYLSHLIENGSTTDRQLVAAASVNARELVDVLLEAGSSVDEGGRWTALEEALYWGHVDMAQYLIDHRGARVRELCSAAALGDLEVLGGFFSDESLTPAALPVHFPWGPLADSTAGDALGQAFLLAMRHHRFGAADYLLDAGYDINAIPLGHHEQCTALHQAAAVGDIKNADWLIERGAVATVQDQRFGATAHQWAVHESQPAMAAHLKQRLP